MFKYAVVEIAGRQYRVRQGESLKVNYLGEIKKLACDKVLLIARDDKVVVGDPYLKDILNFDVIGKIAGKKIRVATYKAKANYRKVKGARKMESEIKLTA